MDLEESEFVLEPVQDRQKVEWAVGEGGDQALTTDADIAEGYSLRADAAHFPSGDNNAALRSATNYYTGSFNSNGTSVVGLPRHRDYPTLESIQRLYKLAGYVGVVGVFGYLVFMLISSVGGAEQGDRLTKLVEFFQYAVPYTFGAVLGAGVLFGAAELIKLAIDIQENTLASAQRKTQKKENTKL